MWVCGNCARGFRVVFYVLILDWFTLWIGWVGAGDVAAGACCGWRRCIIPARKFIVWWQGGV